MKSETSAARETAAKRDAEAQRPPEIVAIPAGATDAPEESLAAVAKPVAATAAAPDAMVADERRGVAQGQRWRLADNRIITVEEVSVLHGGATVRVKHANKWIELDLATAIRVNGPVGANETDPGAGGFLVR